MVPLETGRKTTCGIPESPDSRALNVQDERREEKDIHKPVNPTRELKMDNGANR